jgi:Tol biopolymer transport system component
LSFSRDGHRLLYATDEGRSNLERIAFDPVAGRVTGPLLPVTQGSRAIRSGVASPDGRFVAFDTFSPEEDLFVVRPDGTGLRQLTSDRWKDRGPRWAPDGSRIVFYSDRGGRYELWTIRPDGSGLEVIARAPGQPLYNPAWSPDGRRLACLLGFGGTVWFDLTRPLADRKPVALTSRGGGIFYLASWSRDSDHLVGYVVGHGIARYSFATRTVEPLTPRGEQPVFLPDGQRLLYLDEGKLFFLDLKDRREPRPVVMPAASASLLSVSVAPDGRTLYLVRAVDEGDIWMVTLE